MRHNVFKSMKISRKISLTHSLLFLALQVIIGSVLILTFRIYYPIEASKEVQLISEQIYQNISSYGISKSSNLIQNIIPPIPAKYNVYIKVSDNNGETFLEYGNISCEPSSEVKNNRIIQEKIDETTIIYCNSAIQVNNNEYTIQTVIDITQHLEFNVDLFKVLMILTAVGFVISLFTGSIVARVVLSPLSKINKTAQCVSADNLDVRINTNNTNDELYDLSVTINDMISRLQISFEKQEQLVSDVSHELKTPISVIKGYTSLINRWGKNDADVLQESINRISIETDNMSEMVEKILFLAQNDNGTLLADKNNFEINELIDNVAADTKTFAPECLITIERNDPCLFYGDYNLIKQMLRIIIDNSIKYSDKKCEVIITSENNGDFLFIQIKDSGVGISKDETKKIFNRFYRSDKARNRNKGGTGLGLSIAKAIVNTHNGSINAESEIGIGTIIKIQLPIIKQ